MTHKAHLHASCDAALADIASSYPDADMAATIGHNEDGTPIALRTALLGAAAYAIGSYESRTAADAYSAACARAATAQGLDPIVTALRAAGYPVDVEQTGGFCMVAYVPACTSARIDADRIGITSSETAPVEAVGNENVEPTYLVVVYNGDEDPEGDTLNDCATVTEVLAIVADYRDDDAARADDLDAAELDQERHQADREHRHESYLDSRTSGTY